MSLRSVILRLIPQRLIAPIIARRTWTSRVATPEDDHLTMYWNSVDRQYRRQLVTLVADAVDGAPTPSVLEYGSHVGVNFRMMKDVLPPGTGYFAIDPNEEAIRFLEEKLPDVTAVVADERGFLRDDGMPPSPVTVSLSIAVFYSMSASSTRRVLRKLLRTSSVVIVGDCMTNADGARSLFDPEHASFAHPFATWLRREGATVEIHPITEAESSYAMTGLLVARSRLATSSAQGRPSPR